MCPALSLPEARGPRGPALQQGSGSQGAESCATSSQPLGFPGPVPSQTLSLPLWKMGGDGHENRLTGEDSMRLC